MSHRTFSREFLANVGHRPPGVRQGKGGKLTSTRSERAAKWAAKVLFGKPSARDGDYITGLRNRIKGGIAGPQEIYLWRFMFGDPPKADVKERGEQDYYEAVRREVQRLLRESPEEAAAIAERLTRPRLPPPPDSFVPGGPTPSLNAVVVGLVDPAGFGDDDPTA